MVGRQLLDEQTIGLTGYTRPEQTRRRQVLAETLDALDTTEKRQRYHDLAAANLARWRSTAARPAPVRSRVQVIGGDWGTVTSSLTQQYGVCFATLNMANAYVPGGGYVEGAAAQEENMFRRTDCHFSITDDQYDPATDRYRPEITCLLSAGSGQVLLDPSRPRVCIRGQEDPSRPDLGYAWLPDDQVFPFFELRAAAQDAGGGNWFDPAEARRRIAAQLDTLRRQRIGYAVLSAFGCGAFQNPAPVVALIYREELDRRLDDFELIVFAIFNPGYGPDNLTPFATTLQ